MSQFKTTSSISFSSSGPVAQGEVVGVGVKGKEVGCGVKNVSFWEMYEVNVSLDKTSWQININRKKQAPEIARNQIPLLNIFVQGRK